MSMASDSNPREQKARAFFQYGNDAAMKNNYKYAIQMYQDACKLVPENLVYRQALRGIERRQFDNEPAKVGRMAGARVQPIRLRARAEKAKGNWGRVLELTEEAFVYNPWDVHAARDAAEAAEQLGHKELARFSLESVHAQAGEDVEFIRALAHVYEINEEWQRAIGCWERVRKLAPADEHAKRQINALSASATIARAGLSEALGKPHAPAAPEPAAQELSELKSQAVSPEERLYRQIAEQPDRIGLYLQLADLYKAHNRLDEAEKILARGMKTNPNENLLKSAHAEVQISRLRRAVDAWSKRLKEQPGDIDAQSKLEQLREKLASFELSEYRRRVAQNPDDLNLRYQLGLRLAGVGHPDEAIAEFQQARSDPELKTKALHQLGLCFEAKGLPKLAERNYQEALKSADPDDQALVNTLNYRLGRVFEAQGDLAKAEEHYNEVAANDFGFLDVAQRLGLLSQRAEG